MASADVACGTALSSAPQGGAIAGSGPAGLGTVAAGCGIRLSAGVAGPTTPPIRVVPLFAYEFRRTAAATGPGAARLGLSVISTPAVTSPASRLDSGSGLTRGTTPAVGKPATVASGAAVTLGVRSLNGGASVAPGSTVQPQAGLGAPARLVATGSATVVLAGLGLPTLTMASASSTALVPLLGSQALGAHILMGGGAGATLATQALSGALTPAAGGALATGPMGLAAPTVALGGAGALTLASRGVAGPSLVGGAGALTLATPGVAHAAAVASGGTFIAIAYVPGGGTTAAGLGLTLGTVALAHAPLVASGGSLALGMTTLAAVAVPLAAGSATTTTPHGLAAPATVAPASGLRAQAGLAPPTLTLASGALMDAGMPGLGTAEPLGIGSAGTILLSLHTLVDRVSVASATHLDSGAQSVSGILLVASSHVLSAAGAVTQAPGQDPRAVLTVAPRTTSLSAQTRTTSLTAPPRTTALMAAIIGGTVRLIPTTLSAPAPTIEPTAANVAYQVDLSPLCAGGITVASIAAAATMTPYGNTADVDVTVPFVVDTALSGTTATVVVGNGAQEMGAVYRLTVTATLTNTPATVEPAYIDLPCLP